MTLREKAQLLQKIGHPVRLAILMSLAGQCVCVKEIWQRLALPQAVVSQHLRVLKESGIVNARRDRNRICYSVRPGALTEVFELFSYLHRG